MPVPKFVYGCRNWTHLIDKELERTHRHHFPTQLSSIFEIENKISTVSRLCIAFN